MTDGAAPVVKGHWRYFLGLVLVNLMWAFQYTGARIATQKLSPITVAFVPMVLATVLLGLLLLWSQRGKSEQMLKERASRGGQWLSFLALGIVGCVIAQFGLTSGVKRSLASNASVLTLTIPVLTALLATILAGEKMSRLLWISFPLAIAGVLLVSGLNWHSVHLLSSTYFTGNALILLGCFGSAFYNAYSKRLLRTFTPLQVLVYSFAVADVALAVILVAQEPAALGQLRSAGLPVWLGLGLIAVFSLSSAMMLFFWVITRVSLAQASLSIYLLPVFGVAISAVTLKEKLTRQLLAGGCMVFAATFLATACADRKSSR